MTIATFADAQSLLAERLPGYEPRPQQAQLAYAIEWCLANDEHLFTEGPPGVGKSLASLIPLIVHAVATGERVVVSTATLALQTQLERKDIPFLEANLPIPFTWAVLRGRRNYLCRHALKEATATDVPELYQIRSTADVPGFNGTRESLGFDVWDSSWDEVTVSQECLGSSCPFADDGSCFAEQAKARAKSAQLVVVNHALVMVDMVIRAYQRAAAEQAVLDAQANGDDPPEGTEIVGMLGEINRLCLDEAHMVEGFATSALGDMVSQATLDKLATKALKFLGHPGVRAQCADIGHCHTAGDCIDRVVGAVEDARTAMANLWLVLADGRIYLDTITANRVQWETCYNALEALRGAVKALPRFGPGQTDLKLARAVVVRRVAHLTDRFADVVSASFAEQVRWVETATRRRHGKVSTRKVIRTAPVDPAPFLREHLFAHTPTILLSATLAVRGSFTFVATQLGVDRYREQIVDSPFDFARQAGLYIPTHLPSPSGQTRFAWEREAVAEIGRLIMAAQGRTLVLCTSFKMMQAAHDALAPHLPYTVLLQGTRPNAILFEQFRDDVDSVLFATRGFFQGVDVPGESLSQVIIDKLPFAVPTDPLVEARNANLEARGFDPFSTQTIPDMTLALKQAFGRAVRHTTDEAVISILDPRLATTGWGKTIVCGLPPARPLASVQEVADFFTRKVHA